MATLHGIKRAYREGRAALVRYVETHDVRPIWDDIPHTPDAVIWMEDAV